MRIAIGAIFKNELPYLVEWIAHHRSIGIDRFFLADNESTDGTRELLRTLSEAGIVNLVNFPSMGTGSTQLQCYHELMARFGDLADWIAFIDADEFIMPQGNCRSLKDYLDIVSNYTGVGAIALNWAIYGSSSNQVLRPGLVTERFQLRAGKNFETNLHYKSIVRTSAFSSVGRNPHYFLLKDGVESVHSNGSAISNPKVPGISATVVWTNVRLNHYVVKSAQEFVEKKMTRRWNQAENRTNKSYFKHHDRNEEIDLLEFGVRQRILDEVRKMERLLGFRLPVNAVEYWSRCTMAELWRHIG